MNCCVYFSVYIYIPSIVVHNTHLINLPHVCVYVYVCAFYHDYEALGICVSFHDYEILIDDDALCLYYEILIDCDIFYLYYEILIDSVLCLYYEILIDVDVVLNDGNLHWNVLN